MKKKLPAGVKSSRIFIFKKEFLSKINRIEQEETGIMILKIQIIVIILLFMVIASSCSNKQDEWYIKGLDLGVEGKYAEAIECYDKAIEIAPNFTYAWYNKGLALYYTGKYNEAIKCFDKALEISPEYSPAKTSREEVLKCIGK